MITKEEESLAVGFGALGLGDDILGALTALGYEEPTPVQRETIPLMLEGRDVLAQAATEHAQDALAHVASGNYEGEHWLASFAVFLLSTPTP